MNINEALNILNLTGKVSKDDIKKAYKKMAVKYHPDKNPVGTEVMKAVNSAYEFLKSLDQDIEHTDNENSYNASEKLAEIITELLKMSGLIIEVCGNWIWLDGETKTHKESLKELKFMWASKKKKWYYRPVEYKSHTRGKTWEMEKIRETYGSNIKTTGNNNVIR
ncbi:DnaJ domain-containing protein [Pasteurella atlantica]|uniref:J domain-containing protein n=1 Tax=Phocoenobacter atlanticus TaxID=3416742 RepID=UPI002758E828|nr:DnaJ domain-containing protein [Pasteurella atlantica]MDP8042502.1 DnaJ domain-containing protein [Pasteurella atlantica]